MTTKQLADFSASLEFEQIPPRVVEAAKTSIRDYVAVAMYCGRMTPWGRTIAEFAMEGKPNGQATTVIGYGQSGFPERAALANGTMGMGIEYEDFHSWALTHPYSSIIPAALCVAETTRARGRDFLAGVVVGHEVTVRARMASTRTTDGREISARGIYMEQIVGSLGAAAAAGRVLRLSSDQIAMAMGLAGEHVGGTMRSHEEGAWSRRMHAGRAAQNGVTAALLAQRGFQGPREIIEGRKGLFAALALELEPDKLVYHLGEKWAMTDVWIKAYACVAALHGPIDALLALHKQYRFTAEDVERINVHVIDLNPLFLRTDYPTVAAAQYSAPFCLATAMIKGEVTPDQFEDGAYQDKEVVQFSRERITAILDEELGKRREELRTVPGRVQVKLKDGRVLAKEVEYPTGHPKNPLSEARLKKKFNALATKVLSKKQADAVYALAGSLDQMENVCLFSSALAPLS